MVGRLVLVVLSASLLVAGLGLAAFELLVDPVVSAGRHDVAAAEAVIDELASQARGPIDAAVGELAAVPTGEGRRASCGNLLDGPIFDHSRDFAVEPDATVEEFEQLRARAAVELATAGWDVDLDPVVDRDGVLSIRGAGAVELADGPEHVELDLTIYTGSPLLAVTVAFPDLEAATCG